MKEPVVETIEPVVGEIIEPIVVEKPEPPKKVYKVKEIAKCPDCKMDMTQHTRKKEEVSFVKP